MQHKSGASKCFGTRVRVQWNTPIAPITASPFSWCDGSTDVPIPWRIGKLFTYSRIPPTRNRSFVFCCLVAPAIRYARGCRHRVQLPALDFGINRDHPLVAIKRDGGKARGIDPPQWVIRDTTIGIRFKRWLVQRAETGLPPSPSGSSLGGVLPKASPSHRRTRRHRLPRMIPIAMKAITPRKKKGNNKSR